jgi:hypothetical protein
MNEKTYSIANTILVEAAEKLRSIGLHSMIGRVTMRQGPSLNLHVAETQDTVAAAYVAIGHGAHFSSAMRSSEQFSKIVAEVMATDLIDGSLSLAALDGRRGTVESGQRCLTEPERRAAVRAGLLGFRFGAFVGERRSTGDCCAA